MIYHFKSLVLVRKGRAFYHTLYQEVFFGNPGGGGSLNSTYIIFGWYLQVCFLSSFISIASLKYVRIFDMTNFVTDTFWVVLSQYMKFHIFKFDLRHYIFLLTSSSLFSKLVRVSRITEIRVYLRRHQHFQSASKPESPIPSALTFR